MNETMDKIGFDSEIPADESQRQYHYIDKAKKYVEEISARLNRPLYAAVVTFGCQMNAVHGI